MTEMKNGKEIGAAKSSLAGAVRQVGSSIKLTKKRDLARLLGWFSLGLGALEIAAPKATAKIIGAHGGLIGRTVLRAMGAREIVAGVGIFSTQPRPDGWMRARLAGDLVDIGLLGASLATRRKGRVRHVFALLAVGGVTALDALEVRRLTRRGEQTFGVGASAAVTINKSPHEVYRAWRDLESLPRFMEHLESVSVTGERESHWVARGPGGRRVEWDAEMVRDEPGEEIAWRSKPHGSVRTEGSVRLRPAPGGGTELRVRLAYQALWGSFGAVVAWFLGEEPTQQLRDDVARFKQFIETGEIARSEASPRGARIIDLLSQRPAWPLERAS